MRKISYIIADWTTLIEDAQTEYIFGEPMDIDFFRKCMQEAAECFALGKEAKDSFSKDEVKLYGLISIYSCIPTKHEGEFSYEFEASTRIAGNLASAILQPKLFRFEGSKMIEDYEDDYVTETRVYDFKTGDLRDYSDWEDRDF